MTNNFVFENRVGKFKISERLLVESSQESLAELFSNFVVVDVQVRWRWGAEYTYTAFSPLFDRIEEGYKIPFYDIVITESDDGTLLIEVSM